VRPPADAGARCRAAHRATLGVSPLRLPSLTPARFACCSGQRWGLACCSLHLITAFSPSRSARALHAGVLRPSTNPDCCAAPCMSRSRAIPPGILPRRRP
jgi:hypothetical protein